MIALHDSRELEYIDPTALTRLLDDLAGDVNCLRRFVQDFVSLWDTRARQLADAIAAQVLDTAHVVLLSIRSSSRMVGAPLLETCALVMLNAVKAADLDELRSQVASLIELGRMTCLALGELLDSGPPLAPVTA
ncbi:MAG: hypothetical protein JWQ68_102 [Cryobacterium sp.]|jgi:hypothetical protein|nr:hypothetical protein [Cryobacterium sp.]